ncbi:MAG: hypothetical protein S4CHLAM20_09050 [Chlamydiia bacterium]|nr:hypothetical protein [Chlamydiia bacterium]
MHLKVSKRRAAAISSAILLILLAVNTLTNSWWPYIYLTIGAPLFTRQFLTGRVYESIVTCAIFGGLFIVSNYQVDWTTILPVVFIISAMMIIFREFFNPYASKKREDIDDIDIEITEERKD